AVRASRGLSGRDLDRARSACAVEQDEALCVARLQRAKALFVAIAHDLTDGGGMVEPDRMADFVGERVAQIVDLEVAVKANLPALRWIETNQRLRNRFDALGGGSVIKDVSKGPPFPLCLGADEDVGTLAVGRLAKADLGCGGPHVKRGINFLVHHGGGKIGCRD